MKRRKNQPILPEEQQDYDYETLREDRKYGLYWFSGLWKILRPVLIGLCALLIVFGVLSTVNLAIGQVTPPVGCNLFVACGIGGIQVADIVRPVVPYIIASAIALLIVTLVPGVSTLLPALLG